MVGHTTTTSAKIWIETDVPASVKVQYWLDRQQNYERYLGQPVVKGTAEGRTSSSVPHTGVVQLQDLNPGWLVYYELEVDGRPIRPQPPQAFSLLRFAGTKGNRTVSLQVIDQEGQAQIDFRLSEQHLTPEWIRFDLDGVAR